MSTADTTIMLNDSLAARLFQGHNYKGSLLGDSVVKEWGAPPSGAVDVSSDHTFSFFDRLAHWLASVHWAVYAIVGVLLLALFVYWLYRTGLLTIDARRPKQDGGTENVYEIDYDREFGEALQASDHSRLVRLVYLRTLRTLDEQGRIAWRIYKTPGEYAMELADPVFQQMTNIFLRVRYGRFAADRRLYDTMCAWRDTVLKGGGQ